jgi:glyoxylase-like metal-dependent hydrolase (beta-lactamase superfamily II)
MSLSRRQFIVLSASSAALTAVPLRALLAQSQAPAAPPATRFEPIRGNVGFFTGRGGTIGWLSNKDALVVVDTQFPDTAKLCIEGLKSRATRGIDLVINTHHHGDHTGGNGVFREHAKRILAHARVPELLKQNPGQGAPPTLPTETFDKDWQEAAGDERISARHYGPGHTGGDAVIRFERANVVHMGDLLFHERHPFIDRPAGASIQNWMKTIETVASEMPADTLYIAGHSKEGTPLVVGRKELLVQRDYFDAVLTHVRRGISENKSKDETTKLETLPKFEGYQSSPPRLTLAFVLGVAYEELTAGKSE